MVYYIGIIATTTDLQTAGWSLAVLAIGDGAINTGIANLSFTLWADTLIIRTDDKGVCTSFTFIWFAIWTLTTTAHQTNLTVSQIVHCHICWTYTFTILKYSYRINTSITSICCPSTLSTPIYQTITTKPERVWLLVRMLAITRSVYENGIIVNAVNALICVVGWTVMTARNIASVAVTFLIDVLFSHRANAFPINNACTLVYTFGASVIVGGLARSTPTSIAGRTNSVSVGFFVEEVTLAFAVYQYCIMFINALRAGITRNAVRTARNWTGVVLNRGRFTL